ncbi:MAG: hypothetical protein HKN11_21180 [Rhizobiales bacterium]|nr:hypothetical protein [Hyphomicrobiales bacterium]
MLALRDVAVFCAGLLMLPGISLSEVAVKDDVASNSLAMTIRPAQPGYDLKNARLGNVVILAEVRNTGKQMVLLAHPNVCFPHKLSEGQSMMPDRSQSHLSVVIENPRGTTMVLKNNQLRMFEPGNRHHMTIMSGQSSEFVLGWFGPEYSVGQWNLDKNVFTQPGEYRITVRYKNAYPVAYIFDETGKQSVSDAWIGEFQSNTIVLPIRE